MVSTIPTRVTETLLILAKTYPYPSRRYREITCTAAIDEQGQMRRLFPIPFRFLQGDQQFRKWEWIRATVTAPKDDRRPESRRVDVDSIVTTGKTVGTGRSWQERRRWIEPHVLESFEALEERRLETGETLGFIKPARLLGLDIKPVKEKDWTEEEKIAMSKEGLLDTSEAKTRPPLEKLPYDFYFHYECQTEESTMQNKHKLVDWEVGALYRNCVRKYGHKWEEPFRSKLEVDLAQKDLFFLMGTMHRFPSQWLIVGLVYPPKLPQDQIVQPVLWSV